VVSAGASLPAPVLAGGAVSHELRVQIRGTGLQVTVSYAADASQVNTILAGGSVASPTTTQAAGAAQVQGRAAEPSSSPQAAQAAAATVAPRTDGYGQGFDTCAAPAAANMTAWKGGYVGVGIYIGGPLRACSQPNLTADWVTGRANEGWSFLPIYVGSQATLKTSATSPIPADLGQARSRGNSEGSDAVNQARSLGFTPGAVLYNDMENYNSSLYASQVLSYLSGWIDAVHAAGYQAGVYSSAGSGIADLAANYSNSTYSRPDVVWSARWSSSGQDTTDAGMGLPGSSYWAGAKRVHQYWGPDASGHNYVTYNGVTMDIDQDFLNVSSEATGTGMAANTRLDAGNSLNSASISMTMQSNGDLVAALNVGGSTPVPVQLWHTNTAGNDGAYAIMQSDGNLVVYGAGGAALWASNTPGHPGATLAVQDDGNVVLYDSAHNALWSSDTYRRDQTITAGNGLGPGRWTDGSLTRLVMQTDGNLVIYRKRDGAALWSSYTNGNSGAYLTMQSDGNLVIYRQGGGPSTGGALWATGTWNNPAAYAVNQDDGNFVVYKQAGPTGGALWTSNTYWQAS
jgi:hypothetical protein